MVSLSQPANTDKKENAAHEDPGVISVTEIFNFYKANNYDTVVIVRASATLVKLNHWLVVTDSPSALTC